MADMDLRIETTESTRAKIAEKMGLDQPSAFDLVDRSKYADDESYLDALWYLVLTPGSTERTIAAQRAALRRYLLERGNTVPPRRLWRPLLRMYFSSPRKLLKQPQNAIEQTEDYFT